MDLALAPEAAAELEIGRRLFEALEAAYARPPPASADATAGGGGEELHLDRGMDPEVEKLLREWGYL